MSESKPPNKFMAVNNMVVAQQTAINFLYALYNCNLIDIKTRVEVSYKADNVLQKDLLSKYSNKESK